MQQVNYLLRRMGGKPPIYYNVSPGVLKLVNFSGIAWEPLYCKRVLVISFKGRFGGYYEAYVSKYRLLYMVVSEPIKSFVGYLRKGNTGWELIHIPFCTLL